MIEKFQEYIAQYQLFNKDHRLLLAVSGGVDSVVLTELLYKCGYKAGIAHCNFKLRGNDADADEEFVKKLAKIYKVPFYSTKFETQEYAAKKGISIQMAARELRYEWFEQIRQQEKYHFIATAHHLNDNIETILLNLIKETGIKGLCGIPSKNNFIVRPLLFATKDSIEQYAFTNNLIYQEDTSNQQTKYQRNKIRHAVIPVLKEINPNLENSFQQTISNLNITKEIYNIQLKNYKKDLFEYRGEEIWISLRKLQKLENAQHILYELLSPYDYNNEQINDLFKTFNNTESKEFLSADYRLLKDRKFLVITPFSNNDTSQTIIRKSNTSVIIQNLKFKIQNLKHPKKVKINNDPSIAFINFDKLEFPLTLRKWMPGDLFLSTRFK